MKRLLLFVCLFTGCTSIKWVTTDHGRVIGEPHHPLTILGRPRLVCVDPAGKVVADGYYMWVEKNGSIMLDEYGKDYALVEDPHCRINSNEEVSK